MKYILLFLAALFFASCEQIKEGNVIERWYEPGHTYTSYHHQQIGKTSISTPVTHYVDDYYIVKIKGRLNGKPDTRDVYLTEYEYNRCRIGDHLKVAE